MSSGGALKHAEVQREGSGAWTSSSMLQSYSLYTMLTSRYNLCDLGQKPSRSMSLVFSSKTHTLSDVSGDFRLGFCSVLEETPPVNSAVRCTSPKISYPRTYWHGEKVKRAQDKNLASGGRTKSHVSSGSVHLFIWFM
ncbi:uncharacterized [Tachysurus ichikawai]